MRTLKKLCAAMIMAALAAAFSCCSDDDGEDSSPPSIIDCYISSTNSEEGRGVNEYSAGSEFYLRIKVKDDDQNATSFKFQVYFNGAVSTEPTIKKFSSAITYSPGWDYICVTTKPETKSGDYVVFISVLDADNNESNTVSFSYTIK